MATTTDVQDLCQLTRMRLTALAEQMNEQRAIWQKEVRALQQFWEWEEQAVSGPKAQMDRLTPQERRALATAAAELEACAEAARHDLLRIQHAAGAIHHTAGT